jgi:hypothetical protein
MYPVQQRLTALYRRNALAEQNFNNQNQRSLNALNLLIPLYNKLQNLGVNTAPELSSCQNAVSNLQAAIPQSQVQLNQLNNGYQQGVENCIHLNIQLQKAGLSPVVPQQLVWAQNQVNNLYNEVPSNLAPFTAVQLKTMLKNHLARLPQIQNAISSLNGQVPGEALQPGQTTQYLVSS